MLKMKKPPFIKGTKLDSNNLELICRKYTF